MKQILVVEDEHDVRDVIVDVLEEEGYSVSTAENGQEGIKLLSTLIPDLILCDINMPAMDGYAFRRELNLDREISSIPFVFLTALSEKEDRRRGMSLGANDFLQKPFTIDELTGVVQTQLARREVNESVQASNAERVREELLLIFPHEVNTPLHQVKSGVHLLLHHGSSMDADRRRRLIASIDDGISSLENLSTRFSDMLSLLLYGEQKHAATLFREDLTYPLDEFVESEISCLQVEQAQFDRITWFLEPAITQVGKAFLSRCVAELIGNSLRHTDGSVLIRGVNIYNEYTITVVDEGPGFDVSSFQKVDLFRQFSRSGRRPSGLGLGIAMARRIADLMGGRLVIQSKPDAGTEAMLRLPIIPPDRLEKSRS